MKATKLISIIVSALLVFSVFSTIAFADSTISTQGSTSGTQAAAAASDPMTAPLPSASDIKPVDTTVTTPAEPQADVSIKEPVVNPEPPVGKVGKNDPLRQSLKEKYAKLNDLRAQEKQLQGTLKSQTLANVTLIKTIKAALSDLGKKLTADMKQQVTSARSEAEALRSQVKSLSAQLADARKNKNKDAAAKLQGQIKDLSQQLKGKTDALKALVSSYKTQSAKTVSLRDKVKQAFSGIQVLWNSEKEIYSSIKTLNSSLKAEWAAFNTAIKAKDLGAANSHMENILSLKQQIIDKLNEIGGIKTEVNKQLTDLAASMKI